MIRRQLKTLITDTLREAWSRKVVLSLLLNGTLGIASLFWMVRIYSLSGANSMVTLMGRSDPRYLDPSFVARGVFGNAAMIVFAVELLLCLLTTMSMMTTLLDPARNAWLVSHAVSRRRILIGRYLGLVALAGATLLYTFAGAFVVTGLKVNLWHWPFFAGAAAALLLYCSLSASMLLLHVACSSPALMTTGAIAIGMINVAASKQIELRGLIGEGIIHTVITAAGRVFPRAAEMAQLTNEFVQTGKVENWTPLWASALFAIACLSLASWRFSQKDL